MNLITEAQQIKDILEPMNQFLQKILLQEYLGTLEENHVLLDLYIFIMILLNLKETEWVLEQDN